MSTAPGENSFGHVTRSVLPSRGDEKEPPNRPRSLSYAGISRIRFGGCFSAVVRLDAGRARPERRREPTPETGRSDRQFLRPAGRDAAKIGRFVTLLRCAGGGSRREWQGDSSFCGLRARSAGGSAKDMRYVLAS